VRVEVGMERPEMSEWMNGLRHGREPGVIWTIWVLFPGEFIYRETLLDRICILA